MTGASQRDVVIVGMGVRTALGAGVAAFTKALMSGTSGISYQASDGLGVAARVGEFDFAQSVAAMGVDGDLAARARRVAGRASRSVQVSLLATLEAWMARFPVIHAMREGRPPWRITPENLLDFLHDHLVVRGCADDLVLGWDEGWVARYQVPD